MKTIKTPYMADSITQGTLASWDKKPGDSIEQDETVASIETDKVSIPVNAPEAGVMIEAFAKEGDTVEVGQDLFAMEVGGRVEAKARKEEAKTPVTGSKNNLVEKTHESPKPTASAPTSAPSTGNGLTPVPTTKQAKPAPTDSTQPATIRRVEHCEKMSRMRLRIAERMKESQNIAASLTTFNEVDMSALIGMRHKWKEPFLKKHAVKLGFMSAFVRACAIALLEQPIINARLDMDTTSIVHPDYVDISVAVATPKGLVTPVLRSCQSMSLADIEKGIANLSQKARDGKISLEDMAGGTFTISNGGVFGSLMGTPIINVPQSAILGMHTVKDRPVVVEGKIEVRPMMYIALTYDHRLIDGREAVTFLIRVKDLLEDPSRFLLEAGVLALPSLSEMGRGKNASAAPNGRPKLLVDPKSMWHQIESPIVAASGSDKILNPSAIEALKKSFETHYAGQLCVYRNQAGSESQWMSSMARSGTTADRVSSLTLLVQSATFYSLDHLKTLLAMAEKSNRNESIAAIEALKDLLIHGLLPDRKLFYLHQLDQSVLSSANEQTKLLAFFEDALKRIVFGFLKILEILGSDTLSFTRLKALQTLFELARSKCEQQSNVLAILCNKLGDLDRKLASKVAYYLLQAIRARPDATVTVINEVRQTIGRKNASEKTQYYGVLFLSQIILTRKHPEIAKRLLDIYYELFSKLIKVDKHHVDDDNDTNSRLLKVLLMGINRAYPFALSADSTSQDLLQKYIEPLFRLAHVGNFSASLQSLSLLFQISTTLIDESLAARFYRSLYDILFDERLPLATSTHAMFLSLLYKTIHTDSSMPRVQAFLKRLVQMAASQSPPFLCAVLLLVAEIAKERPALSVMLRQPESFGVSEELSDEETEHFVDVDKLEIDNVEPDVQTLKYAYNPRKRDPCYSRAEKSCFWEIVALSTHYHPTVSKYATAIMNCKTIECKINPLETFTLMAFLEKFVYKNAKKVNESKAMAAERKLGGSSKQKLAYIRNSLGDEAIPLPLNKVYSAGLSKADIPEDELFFAKYFAERPASTRKSKSTNGDDNGQGKTDENLNEEFENEVDRMFDEGRLGDDGEFGSSDDQDESVADDSEEEPEFEGDLDSDIELVDMPQSEDDEEFGTLDSDLELADSIDSEAPEEEDEKEEEEEEEVEEKEEKPVRAPTKKGKKRGWQATAHNLGLEDLSVFMDADEVEKILKSKKRSNKSAEK